MNLAVFAHDAASRGTPRAARTRRRHRVQLIARLALNGSMRGRREQVTAASAGVEVLDSFRTLARKAISDVGEPGVPAMTLKENSGMPPPRMSSSPGTPLGSL